MPTVCDWQAHMHDVITEMSSSPKVIQTELVLSANQQLRETQSAGICVKFNITTKHVLTFHSVVTFFTLLVQVHSSKGTCVYYI